MFIGYNLVINSKLHQAICDIITKNNLCYNSITRKVKCQMSEKTKETMLTYIEESPAVIRKNVDNSFKITTNLVKEFTEKSYKNIWIVASGSSSNGSYCARDFIRKYLNTEVKIITPFTFIHTENNFTDDDFIFVVSQSGYSTNSIDALNVIKAKGRKAIGVTMDLNSDFRHHADLLIDYAIGFETVGYVTKGVTGFALYLMLFTIESALIKGIMDGRVANDLKAEIRKTADVHEMVQKQTHEFYKNNFLPLTSMTKVYCCGVGAGQAIAMEAALKIGETVQIPSIAYEAEEYLHGPSLQIAPYLTIFMIDVGIASKRICDIYDANKIATPNNFMITTNKAYKDDKMVVVVDTDIKAELLPLCFLPFFQIIAYQVTEDTNNWTRHPAQPTFEKTVACKTENYESRSEH